MIVSDCLFCRIVAGEIPATVVFRGDRVVAFRDIDPQAPLHVLVVPVDHHETVADLAAVDAQTLAEMVAVGARVVTESTEAGDGSFRLVFNSGESAGQTVFHVHGHVLAGRGFIWPPG
jgi:histidine triad (HIT) family protein